MSEIKEYYKSILSNYLENISKEEVVEKKYDIPSFIFYMFISSGNPSSFPPYVLIYLFVVTWTLGFGFSFSAL